MQFRKIGQDKVSALGLGCMGMSHAYGTSDEKQNLNTLHAALDLGINFWDTADFYGNGANEVLLSKVLKNNRDRVFICTKFGLKYTDATSFGAQIDGSAKWMQQAVELSLKRLGIDCIDLYYLHRVDTNTPIEETVQAMAKLITQGKIRYIGLSETSLTTLQKAQQIHPIAALQSEYSLLTRDVEKNILPFLIDKQISLVPYSPLGRGMFTENFNPTTYAVDDLRLKLPRFQGEHLLNNQKLMSALIEFAQSKGTTVAALALAWLLHKADNIIPIPGTRQIKYLKSNLLALQITLTADEMNTLEDIIHQYPNTGERYPEQFLKLVNK